MIPIINRQTPSIPKIRPISNLIPSPVVSVNADSIRSSVVEIVVVVTCELEEAVVDDVVGEKVISDEVPEAAMSVDVDVNAVESKVDVIGT